jgi:hypothetical protein
VSRRRLVFLAALWLAGTGVALAMPGCYGRNCEGDTQTWGLNPGEGRMLDDNTWESSSQDGKWLPFPRQRYWRFDLRVLGGRTPAVVIPYVSANDNPNNTPFQNATIGGGNLAEITGVHPDAVTIHNGTCSDYFLRLVVVTAARPPETNTADAAVTDAMTDATSDANASDASPKDAGPDADAGN